MGRGIRNNNPGNIRLSATRYKGEVTPSADPQFKQFESMAWGYRAMFVVLHTYRVRYGLDTIEKIIARYAPPSENDTSAYIGFVERRSGIGRSEQLDTLSGSAMKPVVAAMSRMENGAEPDMADVDAGWELFVKHKP